jgi:hypothetical protein
MAIDITITKSSSLGRTIFTALHDKHSYRLTDFLQRTYTIPTAPQVDVAADIGPPAVGGIESKLAAAGGRPAGDQRAIFQGLR